MARTTRLELATSAVTARILR